MEDFPERNKKSANEKSVYMLQLDVPRILILSSVVIGLIVISLLIGMKINKKGIDNNELFSHGGSTLDSFFNDDKINDSMKNEPDISLLDNGSTLNSFNDDHYKSSLSSIKDDLLKNNEKKAYNSSITENFGKNSETTDILTHENIDTIITPSKKITKRSQAKPAQKTKVKKSAKKRTKKIKQKTVEVASKKKKQVSSESEFAAPKTKKGYYAIQVASFDKRYKAVSEVNNLKKIR